MTCYNDEKKNTVTVHCENLIMEVDSFQYLSRIVDHMYETNLLSLHEYSYIDLQLLINSRVRDELFQYVQNKVKLNKVKLDNNCLPTLTVAELFSIVSVDYSGASACVDSSNLDDNEVIRQGEELLDGLDEDDDVPTTLLPPLTNSELIDYLYESNKLD